MALTPIQQNFVCIFYKKLYQVVSNPDQLARAETTFNAIACEDNPDRYSGQQTFGLLDWTNHQAARFTSTVSEALTQAMEACAESIPLDDIQAASDSIKTNIIPMLIAPRLHPDSFEEELRSILPGMITDLSPVSIGKSALGLFGGVVIVGLSIATAVAMNGART